MFVSPYSHPDVVAGAGTIALEILAERRDIDTLVVPMGGGGLIGGIGIAAQESGAAVIGVEVEASCPFTQSLAAGRIVPIEVGPTLADGLAGNLDPDTITFDLVRRFVERIVVVSEGQLRTATGDLLREERLVVEGAGAAGAAALRSDALDLGGQQVAIVLTGANIDPGKLRELL